MEVMSYKGVTTYVLNDPVTLLKLGPSSPLKRWSVLGFVPRLPLSIATCYQAAIERANKNRDAVLSDLLLGRIGLREVLQSIPFVPTTAFSAHHVLFCLISIFSSGGLFSQL
jgi:hypothetical protein